MKKTILFMVCIAAIAVIAGCVVFQFDSKTGKVFYASANENIDTNAVLTMSLPNDVNITLVLQRKNREGPNSAIAMGRGTADAMTGGGSEALRNMSDPNRNK